MPMRKKPKAEEAESNEPSEVMTHSDAESEEAENHDEWAECTAQDLETHVEDEDIINLEETLDIKPGV